MPAFQVWPISIADVGDVDPMRTGPSTARMSQPAKADPAMYLKLRQHALELRLPDLSATAIHAVLMDWHLGNGTATVLAAQDGTASLYLSSGGGFIGGSEGKAVLNREIRQSALHAVGIAETLRGQGKPVSAFPLPPVGSMFFYLTTNAGVLLLSATEAELLQGSSPLVPLNRAMQRIVTGYRFLSERQASSNTT